MVRQAKWKRSYNPTTTLVQLLFNRSDRFSQPVRPIALGLPKPTCQTGPSDCSDRSKQNRGAAHTVLKCATRPHPNLRVSLHHLPPLCIPADELDTAGAEVNVSLT